jgi:5-methylthioadenosine/S-adenosylhomocysteine deaminase
MPQIHIHNITAVTMDAEDRIRPDAAMVTAGERIAFVGPMTEAPVPGDGDTVIDGAGMVAIPGLINTHTHLAMTLFRGAADDLPLMAWLQEKIWPVEARITEEDVYWASLLGIAEMLRAGVTTFSDMYWHVEAVARAVRESGIRAHLAGVVIGVVPNADELLAKAIERVQAFHDEAHPRITPMFGPHAPYTVPEAMLRTVAETARELGVGIHTHLSETRAEVEESLRLHGLAPIEYVHHVGLMSAPLTAAHCVHPVPAEIPLLVEHGVGVAHCPQSNMKLGSGMALVAEYLRAGVTMGLGTDGAGSNNTLDILREARAAALLAKVGGDPTAVPAAQALAMATRDGARALHRTDIGVLEPGRLADIALLDFTAPHLTPSEGREVSHLVYAAGGADVDTVVVHGQVLMRGRRLLGLDEPRIRAHVCESAQRLFGGTA